MDKWLDGLVTVSDNGEVVPKVLVAQPTPIVKEKAKHHRYEYQCPPNSPVEEEVAISLMEQQQQLEWLEQKKSSSETAIYCKPPTPLASTRKFASDTDVSTLFKNSVIGSPATQLPRLHIDKLSEDSANLADQTNGDRLPSARPKRTKAGGYYYDTPRISPPRLPSFSFEEQKKTVQSQSPKDLSTKTSLSSVQSSPGLQPVFFQPDYVSILEAKSRGTVYRTPRHGVTGAVQLQGFGRGKPMGNTGLGKPSFNSLKYGSRPHGSRPQCAKQVTPSFTVTKFGKQTAFP